MLPQIILQLSMLDCTVQSLLGNIKYIEEVSNLVSILARSWHFNRSSPIEVKVAQSESQLLNFKSIEWRLILRNVEMGWQAAALSSFSRRHVEVEHLVTFVLICGLSDTFIDNAASWWILKLATLVLQEETLIDTLIYENHGDFRLSSDSIVMVFDCVFKLLDFSLDNLGALSISNTVTVNNKVLGLFTIVV